MAKKNLSHLLDGIIAPRPVQEVISDKEDVREEDTQSVTGVEQKEETQAKGIENRGKKMGRPKKAVTFGEDACRTSFIMRKSVIKKLKYMSVMESVMITDMVDKALGVYIKNWERKHGEIKGI